MKKGMMSTGTEHSVPTHREFIVLQTTNSKNFKDGTILAGNLIKIQHLTVI